MIYVLIVLGNIASFYLGHLFTVWLQNRIFKKRIGVLKEIFGNLKVADSHDEPDGNVN